MDWALIRGDCTVAEIPVPAVRVPGGGVDELDRERGLPGFWGAPEIRGRLLGRTGDRDQPVRHLEVLACTVFGPERDREDPGFSVDVDRILDSRGLPVPKEPEPLGREASRGVQEPDGKRGHAGRFGDAEPDMDLGGLPAGDMERGLVKHPTLNGVTPVTDSILVRIRHRLRETLAVRGGPEISAERLPAGDRSPAPPRGAPGDGRDTSPGQHVLVTVQVVVGDRQVAGLIQVQPGDRVLGQGVAGHHHRSGRGGKDHAVLAGRHRVPRDCGPAPGVQHHSVGVASQGVLLDGS